MPEKPHIGKKQAIEKTKYRVLICPDCDARTMGVENGPGVGPGESETVRCNHCRRVHLVKVLESLREWRGEPWLRDATPEEEHRIVKWNTIQWHLDEIDRLRKV